MQTVRPVKKGEILFSHYGYRKDFLREPMKGKEWYFDEWQEYEKPYPNSPQCSKCYEISDMEFLIKIFNQIDILGIIIDHFQCTPSISEIIWVRNVRAIVVCGFFMKSLKKHILKI